MEDIRIRRMEEGDLDRLAILESRCFSIPWSRAMLADELSNDRALYLVAACEGSIAVYAGASRSRASDAVTTPTMARMPW